MTIKAKEVLKNKFWIVEENGTKVGTLSANEECYTYSCSDGVQVYSSFDQLIDNVGKVNWTAGDAPEEGEKDCHGYPTSCVPFNPMYDLKNKLPLFTKSEKSKSVYCAGYYLIKFNVNWLKSFCPKLITIERNEYLGPFKTEIEMRTELSRVNSK